MSLFKRLENGQNQQSLAHPQQMAQKIRQLRENPVHFLKELGYEVPDGSNDPRQIIQHLMQSGQVPQSRYQQALQTMRGFVRG